MADLRSEIEARKSRIEQLRRQRETLARNGLVNASPPLSHSSSIVSLSGPLIEIEAPFHYVRRVQTDSVKVASSADTNSVDSSREREVSVANDNLGSEMPVLKMKPDSFRVVEQSILPPSLLSFVDDSWRAVTRALSSAPAVRDYSKLYSSPAAAAAGGSLLKQTHKLSAAVGLIAWSPHFDDLLVTRGLDSRRALVWSLEAPDLPEFTLRSPTPITEIAFSPHNPQTIYAGGANGQIMMWDLQNRICTAGARLDVLPQLRSRITNAGILKLLFVGPSLISLDEEGTLQVWSSDQLSRPRYTTLLEDRFRTALPALKMTSGLVPTALAITTPYENGFGIGYGTGICVIGSIQGQLLRLPALPSSLPKPFQWKHAAPVSCLSFRPTPLPMSGSSKHQGVLLASGGFDWRIRIWLVPNSEAEDPIELLHLNIDYAVSDICWHPAIPSVLASVGETQVQIWNLDRSFVKAVYTGVRDAETISRVAFGSLGLGLATDRCVSIFSVAEDAVVQGTDDWLAKLRQH